MCKMFLENVVEIKTNISSKVTKCILPLDWPLDCNLSRLNFSKDCWGCGTTILEKNPGHNQDKRRSVSLCSLRSLRASMCQLFKIHKARGECQERTKFNDLVIDWAWCEVIESVSGAILHSLGKVSIKDRRYPPSLTKKLRT